MDGMQWKPKTLTQSYVHKKVENLFPPHVSGLAGEKCWRAIATNGTAF